MTGETNSGGQANQLWWNNQPGSLMINFCTLSIHFYDCCKESGDLDNMHPVFLEDYHSDYWWWRLLLDDDDNDDDDNDDNDDDDDDDDDDDYEWLLNQD